MHLFSSSTFADAANGVMTPMTSSKMLTKTLWSIIKRLFLSSLLPMVRIIKIGLNYIVQKRFFLNLKYEILSATGIIEGTI